MQSTLHCFGVGVVLLSLAPPSVSFSRGASHTSCQEMIPGHIRAQPQDPQHSHVTLRTSASSYLPGQLVTVTVRSSRDFMGFLLQARTVDSAGGKARAGVRAGVRGGARAGVRAGHKSTRVGPALVGGSWTVIPPGTHALRCLSEDDTLTHSDKQLKRNLSFVWRAPDAPMGDIRFYITVVQSYFVYWAALRSHRASKKERKETAGPATFVGRLTSKSSETQSYKFVETVTRPVLEMNSSAPLASLGDDHISNQPVDERNSQKTSGTLLNATSGSETDSSATSAGLTEEAGSFVTEDPKTSLLSSSHLLFTTSFLSAETTEMEVTTTLYPNITKQNLPRPFSLLRSLTSFPRLMDVEKERKQMKLPVVPETKDATLKPQTTTTSTPSTNHSFHNTNPPRPITNNPGEPIQDQTSSVKFETPSSSLQPWRSSLTKSQMSLMEVGMDSQSSSPKPFLQVQTSQSKPLLQSHTGTSQMLFSSQAPQPSSFPQSETSLPNHTLQSKPPTPWSFLQSHTTSSLTSPYKSVSDLPKPQTVPKQTSPSHPPLKTTAPLSSHPEALPETTPTQTQGFPQTEQSQSDTPPEASSISPQPWSQSQSPTGAPQAHTFEWKRTKSSVTPRSLNPLLFPPRFDPTVAPDEGQEVTNQSHAKIKTMSLIFAVVPLTTSSPYFSGSTPQSTLLPPSSTSTHILSPSSIIHTSSTTPLYPSRGSTSVSMHSPFRSTLITRSLSSSMKNQPKTAPAASALPSPSPISIPPHFPSVQPSLTHPIPSSNSSNHLSPAPSFDPVPTSTPSSSPFTSSQFVTGSTFSSPSSSTISPTLTLSSSISSPSSSPIPTFTQTSSSSPGSSSSFVSSVTSSFSTSSQSTSPHLEPSPAPLRSLYNPLIPSSSPVPSQKLILGQSSLIQNHIAPSDPEPNVTPSTQRAVVHPNPEPHPNLDPNTKLNLGHDLKPNLPKTDTKPKHPSNPSGTPDKEGKYPDIIPRHSAWELGMLLGCSAGLGMVLVVGVRYIYRQACGKQTEVTLNDREREYGRGERGLIHVQECGDLVRVRRIRENSFVLLAEYDILASPGD
ncbi:uncharacterized protein LOC130164908 [Seriola aureovittata]|uniref:uncharacterized protein LOC130164908 n=1 Tax=Seriola aureovittata TaxID=2871759 RepID=UPI0024BDBC0E|nr:uncharacterized protein LOC130164908 [Seriola aureovittata]